jgi:3D (Asp-Asp-Asp) domain-containing protein
MARVLVWAVFVLLLATSSFAAPLNLKDYPDRAEVTVTAYTNIPECTKKGDPNTTASMLKIERLHYRRLVAFSRDLASRFKFGQRFYLVVGGKVFDVEFQDIMNKKHRNKIDLLLGSKRECLEFGVKKGTLVPIRWE